MEQPILVEDVKTNIVIWSAIFVVYLVIMLIYTIRVAKKLPKKPHKDNADTQELLRQYHNKSMISFCMCVVWAIGVVLICLDLRVSGSAWLIITVLVLAMIYPLLHIRRKKK